MSDSFDEMRRQIAGLESPALRAIRDAFDPVSRAMQATNPGNLIMGELEWQQRLTDLLTGSDTPATRALLGINDVATALASQAAGIKPIYDASVRPAFDYAAVGLTHQDAIARATMGPLAELRDSGVLTNLLTREATAGVKALTDYESQFRLPTLSDFDAIATTTRADNRLASLYGADFLEATKAANYAFVRVDDPATSIKAFAELQMLSRSVVSLPPFDEALNWSLRADLGDWRDLASVPQDMYANIALRTAFYVDRGLRTDLTDFPANAFESVIAIRKVEAISLADHFGDPIEAPDDEDPTEFARTNEVQGWLHRYERRMRSFIDQRMTKAHGSDWPRLKLPPEIYRNWLDKSQKAAAAGKPSAPLILFADFTHYMTIVCNRGNWPLFQDAFGTNDPAPVRESFCRLELPRLEVSHGRILTQEDYLFVFAELARMGKALKS